jgi:chloramphenicol O-acetyltransferase
MRFLVDECIGPSVARWLRENGHDVASVFDCRKPIYSLMESLEEIMAKLPPEHQQEVRDFAQFLAEKKAKPKRRKLKLDWAGGLKEFREQYTSLELQKKSLDWWGD